MMVIEELEPKHFEAIKLRPYEKETMAAFQVRLQALISAAVLGPAYAFIYNGEIVALGGIAMLWGKVGEAWLLSAEPMNRHGLVSARAIIRKLRQTEMELGDRLERLQAQAPVSHPSAHRWIQWLGLEKESVAKKYSATGEDAVIYAKVKNGN